MCLQPFRLSLFIVAIASSNALCSENEQAQKLLTQMEAATEGSTLSADIAITSSQAPLRHMKWLRRTRPDGDMESRIETKAANRPFIVLNLPDGMWTILPHLAVKNASLAESQQSKAQYLAGLPPKDTNSTSIFSVIEMLTNDCYVVTEAVSDSAKQEFKDSLNAPKAKEIVSEYKGLIIPLVCSREYVFSRENFLPRSYSEFGRDGKLILRIQYTNVQVNIPLADDLFVIPNNIPRQTANSLPEYHKLLGGDPSMVMSWQLNHKLYSRMILGVLTLGSVIMVIITVCHPKKLRDI
jgi:hypothetical protein